MHRFATLAVVAALTALSAGCDEGDGFSLNLDIGDDGRSGKGKDKDQPIDLESMNTARDCGFRVGQAHPFQGEENIFLADNWSFDRVWVTEPSEPLFLEIVQVDTGEVVEAYQDDQGYYQYVVPYEPVAPETRYLLQATTESGCTARMSTFTTGVWGRAHRPTTHTAYMFSDSLFGDTNWDALNKMLFWRAGWMAVWQAEEGDWAFGGWFEGQDTCTPTVSATGGFHRGELSLHADEVVLGSVDRPIPLYDVTMRAVVAEGAEELERVDIETLADLWWVGQDEGLSCKQVLKKYGSDAHCTTCPDGTDWCAVIDTDFYIVSAGSDDASDWQPISFDDSARPVCTN